MADSTLNRFVSSGTTAERTAFTPDPPTPASGPDPSYLWWDVDLQTEFAYDFGLADWVEIGTGGGGSGIRYVGIVIDGGGSTITTGVKGFVSVPVTGTLIAWRILSIDASATAGAIVIDVWKDTYANYPPTDADSITNGNEPEVTASANKAEDVDLSDWTTQAVTKGQIIGFNVDSVATFTRVLFMLEIQE